MENELARGLQALSIRVEAIEKLTASHDALVQRLAKEMWNGGKDGLKQMVTDFIARYDATQESAKNERAEARELVRQTDRKWNLRFAALTLLLAAFSAAHGCDGKKIALESIGQSISTPQDAATHYTARNR